MKNLLHLTVFAALLALSACNKKTDTPAEEPAATTTGSTTSSTPTPTTAGYYLRWESFSNGNKYYANAFANGKVYNSPYTYSEDYGETWKTAADDGLARTLVNFSGLAAEKKTNSAGTVFTILSTGATLSFSNSLSLTAWDGSSNAFVWSNGVLYKTTNTGSSWTAISSPPTHNDFIAIADLEMSGSTVFVVQQFLEKPGNYTRYILQTSSDGGAT